MEQWQRRRHPDDVPTPIAVAVADFCRRAKGRAPAAVVREALAVLSDDDDFRVKELTDAEPAVRPLGPFAVVDVVQGTAPKVAAQREETGYYDLVRSLAAKTTAPARPSPAPRPPAARKEPAPALAQTRKQKKEASSREQSRDASLAQQIAPRKRVPAAAPEKAEPPPPAAPWKRRALPTPRGKFTRIEAEAERLAELHKPEAKAGLMDLIEQTGNRISLRKTLERQYVVRRGVAPSPDDVDALLERHKLTKAIERKEREGILAALTEHHGAMAKVAWAMGLNPFEVDRLVALIGIRAEVDQIRDRWVREALSTRNLPMRLEMMGRGKYLADLKIVRRFKEALVRDILEVLEALPVMPDLDQLLTVACKRHALQEAPLRAAIAKLGIEAQLDFQPSAEL